MRAPRRRVQRPLAALLGLCGLLVVAALWLRAPVLAVAAAFVSVVVAVGVLLPPARPTATMEISAGTLMEGNPIELRMGLRNRNWRSALVSWKLHVPPVAEIQAGASRGVELLSPRGAKSLQCTAVLPLFGLHRFGPVEMRVADPLGLTEEAVQVGLVEAGVGVRRTKLGDTQLRSRQPRPLFGIHEVSQPGSGFEFFGLRDYVVGDRPRDVNWKASGRRGTLIVNQHEKENNLQILVLVDVRASARGGRQTRSPFANGVRAAVAVAEAHLRQRDDVRVVAFGSTLHEDRHTGIARRLEGLLELVLTLEPEGDRPLKSVVDEVLPRLRRGSPVCVVSPLIGDDSIVEAVATLRSHDLPVTALVPKYDWGPRPDADSLTVDAAQAAMVQELRGLGVRVVQFGDMAQLDALLGGPV